MSATDPAVSDGHNPFPERKPPRTRRGRESRDHLLRAARTIFERDGYAGARIADVTDAAEMAHGNFYNYFESKEEIFWAVLGEVRRDMLTGFAPSNDRRSTRTLTADDQLQNIVDSNADFIESYQRNAAMIKAMEEVATYNDDFRTMRRDARVRFIKRVEVAIQNLQSAGVADPDLEPWCSANALAAMMDRFCYAWFVLGDEFEEDTARVTLDRLWFNALGVDPHRRPAGPINASEDGHQATKKGTTEDGS